MEELISLKFAAKIIKLEHIPEDPYHQYIFRATITDQIRRYGIFTVHSWRDYYREELEALIAFDS